MRERSTESNWRNVNLITKTTQWVMEILRHYVREGDTVIDATMGNGHDTLALVGLVGESGKVIAFDIQPQALENTRTLLVEQGVLAAEPDMMSEEMVRLILDSNDHMASYCAESAAVLFNLGYLPGGDKTVATDCETTLRAAKMALELLRPGGLLAMVVYSGHPAGAEEKAGLLAWAKTLPAREYHVAFISMWNQPKHPPEILLVTRK